MKSWKQMGVAVGMAVAVVLWADNALAAGQSQTRAGSGKGSVKRTSTQTRQQLRDGSCLTGTATGTAKSGSANAGGNGTRQQLRDGSCQTAN